MFTENSSQEMRIGMISLLPYIV